MACPRRMRPNRRRRSVRRAVAGLCVMAAAAAHAQNATWTGLVDGNYTTGGNWSTGAEPVGTGFFNAAGAVTTITITAATPVVGGWTIVAGAPQYDFINNASITFTGAGISRLTTDLVVFDNNLALSRLLFQNSSSAGTARYFNRGEMSFFDSATAGGAEIINDNLLIFEGSSSAGTAVIGNTGTVLFAGNASGATARLTGSGTLDISPSTGGVAIGSLEGSGIVALGARTLTVGGLGLSTTYGGTIQDGGGLVAGTGGALVKAGGGTLILTGANTYTGGTTINGGTLQLGAGGTTGSIVGDVLNNATLAFNRSNTLTFAGVISGTGAVQQIGTGTTILTGASTYTGGTTITAGTLQIGDGGTTGSIPGDVTVAASAFLAFNRSDDVTFAGVVSGGGGLDQIGPGRVVLTGDNSYTGGTNICACAVLQIGDGGTTGAIVGDVVNDGLLVFNRSDTITFAGVVSGGGDLQQTGPGTLRLTGVNTFTGSTIVSAGTLVVAGELAGTSDVQVSGTALLQLETAAAIGFGAPVILADSARLRTTYTGDLDAGILVTANTVATFSAAPGTTIRFTGPFFADDRSILTFGAPGDTGTVLFDPAFTAATGVDSHLRVAAGTLRAASDELGQLAFLMSSVQVAAGATLDFNDRLAIVRNLTGAGSVVIGSNPASILAILVSPGTTQAFGGVISGAGGVDIATDFGVDGRVVLTGNNTYTGGTLICACTTLQLGAGGATGSIVGNVVNGGTLAFNRSDTYVFTGTISDDPLSPGGRIVQMGPGTLVLTAANTYTGTTTVLAGALVVNGSIAASSGLTTAAGTTVGGTGTLPTSVIAGTLAPGNSIGTISVAGNLTFGGTGVYVVEVGTATADRTNVTGTAAVAGTVRAVPAGQPLAFGTRYTILNAAGGVTGTFGSVQNLLGPAFAPVLSYDANNVFLTLSAIALAPTVAGLTQNQQAVVNGLDRAIAAGGNANPFLPLFLLAPAALPAALDQLSGEAHTGTQGLGVLVSDLFLRVMLDQNAFGRTPGSNPALAYAPDALAGLPGVVAATQAADLPVEVIDTRRFAVWGAAFGADGRIGGDAGIGAARRHERSTGLAAGVDMRVAPGTVVGVALAGGGADASISGRGSLSADVFQAGLYAMTRLGMLDLRAALAYTHLDIDSTRSIPALGIPTLTASYEAEVWSGRIEAAVPLTAFSGLSIAPVAALQVQSVRQDGFTETTPAGPVAAGLTVAGRTQTTSRAELGARFEARFGTPGLDATAFARLAWAHYFERDASVTAALAGLPGSTFTVIGARPDRDAALISAGIDVRLTPQLSIGARFDGELSGNVSQYAGTARIRFEF